MSTSVETLVSGRYCLCNHAQELHTEGAAHGCLLCRCEAFEHDPTYEPPPPLPLDRQIDVLHRLRESVAGVARAQALLELDGRLLRLALETEKRQAGATKGDAERDAKADDRYLAHARREIERSFDRAVLEADAEAAAYEIQLQLAVLRRTEGAQ